MSLPATAARITAHLSDSSKLIRQFLPRLCSEDKLLTPTSLGFLSEVALEVLDQVGVAPEALPALGAAVGPLPAVHAVMLDQVWADTEGLSAHLALVRLLAGVHTLVLGEVHALVIAFPTLPALKRFLSRVDSPVLDEVGGLKEKFPAVVTSVSSLAVGVWLPVHVCDGTEVSFLGRGLPWFPHGGVDLPPFYHAVRVANSSKLLTRGDISFRASWGHPGRFGFIRNLLYHQFHVVVPGLVIWDNRGKMETLAYSPHSEIADNYMKPTRASKAWLCKAICKMTSQYRDGMKNTEAGNWGRLGKTEPARMVQGDATGRAVIPFNDNHILWVQYIRTVPVWEHLCQVNCSQ